MPFVLFVSCGCGLQGVGRVNVHPHRACISLPDANREAFVGVAHRFLILSRLAHRHQVIGDSLSAHAAILFELLVQKPDCLGALHSRHRVLPDANLTVKHKAGFFKELDELATEVPQADHAVPLFGKRQVHAVKRDQPPRHQHPVKFIHDVFELLVKLRRGAAVSQVSLAVGVGVEACKWGGENRIVDAVGRDSLQNLRAVPVVEGIAVCNRLVNHIYAIHAGISILSTVM